MRKIIKHLARHRSSFLLLAALLLFVVPVLFAMQAPVPVTPVPPNPTPPMGVGEQVIVIAGVIATALQGLKKLVPQINGKIAVAISIAGALAGAYAVAQPGQVVSVQFLLTTLGAALGSNGIYSLLKKPQMEPNPGDGAQQAGWHK